MSRPVLGMSFYSPSEPNHLNPYSAMVTAATTERLNQQIAKQAITGALGTLTAVVQHFFPERADCTPKHRPLSGPYQFDREYFLHLENNLKAINDQLQQLEHSV